MTNAEIDSSARRVLRGLALAVGLSTVAVLAQPRDARLSDQDAEALIAEIKEVAAEADKVLASFESPRLDRRVVLEQRDHDLERIVEWVRTETRWVPYRGVLRGAAGVLMDRRGNSLDRSLLLAELLDDAGLETRLARASLSRQAAETLLEAHAYRGTPPSQVSRSPAIRAWQEEVGGQVRDLAALSGLSSAVAGAANSDQVRADISDHWWVQVKRGAGWTDLDPMDPRGISRPAGQGPKVYATDSVPRDLFHRLNVRVVTERWEAGRLVEAVALSHGFPVAEVPLFTQVEIQFLPFAEEWADRKQAEGGLDALAIAATARFWRPVLRANATRVSGKWVSAAGRFELPATLATARKLEDATAAVAALVGGRSKASPESHLTAAWLEYVTSAPGGRGERVRREVFDLLKGQRDPGTVPQTLSLSDADITARGLALQARTWSLVLTSTPHVAAVHKTVIASTADNRDALIALVYLAAGRQDDRVPRALSRSVRRIDLLAMAVLRERLSRHGDLTYLDRPNVLSSHLIRVPGSGTATLHFATDVVMHRIGVVPGSPLDPRLVRLEQGVLDTLVETAFSGNAEAHNTFGHFARRSQGSGSWRTLAPGSSPAASLAGLPPEYQARLRSAVREGGIVVTSPGTYSLGDHRYASWWRIDPSDGTTLGFGYRGWGQDTAEYGVAEAFGGNVTKEVAKETGEAVTCRMVRSTYEIVVGLADTMDMPAVQPGPNVTQELSKDFLDALADSDKAYAANPERRRLLRKLRALGGKFGGIPCWIR